MSVPVLWITGTVGAGKTSVAYEVSGILEAAEVLRVAGWPP